MVRKFGKRGRGQDVLKMRLILPDEYLLPIDSVQIFDS
jgi:hypothetical protein